jgi:hypothetical protein
MLGPADSNKIEVSIHFADVTLSFLTDPMGSNIADMTKSIQKILTLYGKQFSAKSNVAAVAKKKAKAESVSASGIAETSIVKGKIRELLIPSNYFQKGRTTQDVRVELEKKMGIKFQSRKVSQALGELRKRRLLSRAGSKGHFVYLQV